MKIDTGDLDMVSDLDDAVQHTAMRKRGKFPKEVWAALGEEFRSLRTRVRGALNREPHRVLLVTSAVPQEGKTTVSLHLARSFAAAGQRTLLIDADLRRPDLHLLFGIDQPGGVSEVVQGRLALEETVTATDIENLFVLTAGARTKAPAELIDSQGFSRMLKTAAERYDCVVLDSAPLVSITDSQVLARYVDGILLVVAGLATPREIVKNSLEQIQDRAVLGIVLNGISTPTRYGYYY